MDDGAKEHCIYLFADFLYRNWTTHAVVLDCFQQELKTLPPVLQFALLQVRDRGEGDGRGNLF